MQREIKFAFCRNQVCVLQKSSLRFAEIKIAFQRIKFTFCRNQDCILQKSSLRFSEIKFSCVYRNQVYVSKNQVRVLKNQVLFHRIKIAFQRIKFTCKESSCCNIVNELRLTR